MSPSGSVLWINFLLLLARHSAILPSGPMIRRLLATLSTWACPLATWLMRRRWSSDFRSARHAQSAAAKNSGSMTASSKSGCTAQHEKPRGRPLVHCAGARTARRRGRARCPLPRPASSPRPVGSVEQTRPVDRAQHDRLPRASRTRPMASSGSSWASAGLIQPPQSGCPMGGETSARNVASSSRGSSAQAIPWAANSVPPAHPHVWPMNCRRLVRVMGCGSQGSVAGF